MRMLVGLMVLVLAVPASANLLQDGGFEQTTANPDGWTGQVDYDRPESGPGGPAEGDHYFSSQAGCTGGPINSTMTSVIVAPSTSVVLTGYWHLGGPAPMNAVIKLLDGSSAGDVTIGSVTTQGIPGWAAFQIGPGHIQSGHVKIIASWTCGAGWNTGVQMSLDGLVLEAVPEPASLGLFALVGLPLLRRRR